MYHGIKTKASKKRRRHSGGVFPETQIGEEKRKKVSTKSGGSKNKVVKASRVNVAAEGGNMVCEITGLEENPSNKDYTRRKVITRGAVLTVKSPDGKEFKVKVSSRPGQDGVINAKPI